MKITNSMKKIITLLTLAILSFGFTNLRGQDRDMQYFRPSDKTGLNVFETSKQDDTPFNGLKVRIGGSNTIQFQGITVDNSGAVTPLELGSNFNLATSNFDIDAQLYDGLRMHLRTYLSSRHHPEPYVKDGYIQIDKLEFIDKGFAENLMQYITVKIGHMEVNYGDAHFRRSDNGQALYNPFVGNYIMDSFTTEVAGEFYFKKNNFLAMVGLTNGKLNQSTVKAAPGAPEYKPVFVGKLGYDTQVNPDLRFRLTGSIYTTGESGGNYLYTGDRAGGRYYNVLAVETSDFRTGRFNPGFSNEITAIMLNTFIKYQGLEFFGLYENSSGKAVSEASRRTFNHYGAELIYRIGEQEDFYLGGRYNAVSGELNGGADIDISRINIGGGWFMTKNVLAKAEFVSQKYNGFANDSIFHDGKFSGFVLEAVVSF